MVVMATIANNQPKPPNHQTNRRNESTAGHGCWLVLTHGGLEVVEEHGTRPHKEWDTNHVKSKVDAVVVVLCTSKRE